MEPVNKDEARKQRLAEWRERNKEVIAEAMKKYEVITCECGGKIQRLGQTRHAKTKMHINFLQQQEERDRLQEVEDIKEQEIRDNNAEVETWKAEDLQGKKKKQKKMPDWMPNLRFGMKHNKPAAWGIKIGKRKHPMLYK